MSRLTVFTIISSRQDYSDLLRQCDDDYIHNPYGWQLQEIRYGPMTKPQISDQNKCESCRIIHFRDLELASQPVIVAKFELRMATTSQPISLDKKLLGTSSNLPFLLSADITNPNIQQSLLGSSHKWSKCKM